MYIISAIYTKYAPQYCAYGIVKTFREIVSSDDELQEIIQDTYDFEYDKKMINEDLLADDINIRLNGRLIYIEIDI